MGNFDGINYGLFYSDRMMERICGRDGLEKARAERPDLVTLDITMPEKSGIKFYRELKDDPELAATPVVIVTAVTGYGGDPDVFHKFISTRKQVPPPEAFVTKPINADDFVKTVAKVLSSAARG